MPHRCALLTALRVLCLCGGDSITFPAALLPVLNAMRVASPILRVIISFADVTAMASDPFLIADTTSVTLQPMEMQALSLLCFPVMVHIVNADVRRHTLDLIDVQAVLDVMMTTRLGSAAVTAADLARLLCDKKPQYPATLSLFLKWVVSVVVIVVSLSNFISLHVCGAGSQRETDLLRAIAELFKAMPVRDATQGDVRRFLID